MTTILFVGGIAMLSAGVSILALVRAYEGVVLAHVTIDPEGDDAAPSGTAREASPGRPDPNVPPHGYARSVNPCGHNERVRKRWTSRHNSQMVCIECGALWDPASRNELEIASDGFLYRSGLPKPSGREWTRPYGDYDNTRNPIP